MTGPDKVLGNWVRALGSGWVIFSAGTVLPGPGPRPELQSRRPRAGSARSHGAACQCGGRERELRCGGRAKMAAFSGASADRGLVRAARSTPRLSGSWREPLGWGWTGAAWCRRELSTAVPSIRAQRGHRGRPQEAGSARSGLWLTPAVRTMASPGLLLLFLLRGSAFGCPDGHPRPLGRCGGGGSWPEQFTAPRPRACRTWQGCPRTFYRSTEPESSGLARPSGLRAWGGLRWEDDSPVSVQFLSGPSEK